MYILLMFMHCVIYYLLGLTAAQLHTMPPLLCYQCFCVLSGLAAAQLHSMHPLLLLYSAADNIVTLYTVNMHDNAMHVMITLTLMHITLHYSPLITRITLYNMLSVGLGIGWNFNIDYH